MKINTLKSRWFLSVLSCATLSMSSQSNGAVSVLFEQVGADVVAAWSGDINPGNFDYDSFGFSTGANALSTEFLALDGLGFDSFKDGIVSETSLSLSGIVQPTSIGGSFGFGGPIFYVSGIADSMADATIYNFSASVHKITFAGKTLAAIGADNFNNTIAWTSSAGGTNTVSYTTVGVPEPSSSVLVALGALTLTIRRRR